MFILRQMRKNRKEGVIVAFLKVAEYHRNRWP